MTDDKFFEELYINYAMIIMKIMKMDWNADPDQPEQKISLKRLKKNICKAEGYERDMLALLYGSTGIINLESKTRFLEQGGKIQLKDVSDTQPSVITGAVPDNLESDGRNGNDSQFVSFINSDIFDNNASHLDEQLLHLH